MTATGRCSVTALAHERGWGWVFRMFTWLGRGVSVFTMHRAGQDRAGSVDWVSL